MKQSHSQKIVIYNGVTCIPDVKLYIILYVISVDTQFKNRFDEAYVRVVDDSERPRSSKRSRSRTPRRRSVSRSRR